MLSHKKARRASERLAHLEFQGREDMCRLLENLEPRNPDGEGFHVSLIRPDVFTKALDKLDDFFLSRGERPVSRWSQFVI